MSQSEVWNVKRLLEWTIDFFNSHQLESARLESEVLLAHALKCTRIDLYTQFDSVPDDSQRAKFRDLVRRRVNGEPVAYLVGHKEFYSLRFDVSPAVLIPRPETEQLVLEVLDYLKKCRPLPSSSTGEAFTACDLGTGTGCISVALAKNMPHLHLTAIDLSPEALEVAQKNVERHHMNDRIDLLHSDLLNALTPDEQFDLIVSNPPYISEEEYRQLDPTVRNYEPKLALLAGSNGTSILQRIAKEAPPYLKPHGKIFLEISPMIAEKVYSLFKTSPDWKDVQLLKDFAGLNRVLISEHDSNSA